MIVVVYGGSGGNVDSGLIMGTLSKGNPVTFKLLPVTSLILFCIYIPLMTLN